MTLINTPRLARWIADYSSVISENAAFLTELDRQIGDADHGSNMDRGMKAAVGLNPDEYPDPSTYLKKVGMTLVSTIGGASGPLYGTLFLRMAGAWADEVDVFGFGKALRAGFEGVLARGKAAVGEKTMIDALAPAVAAYEDAANSGADLEQALAKMVEAAQLGRDATIPMVARKGRASYLGERSAGHMDPGAASTTLLLESAARALP